jgi:LuxR family quorum-sensing system transcriptional regulator SolR
VRAWQNDPLQVLMNETHAQSVFDKLANIARQIGFDHCAYGLRPMLPLSRQRIVVYTTHCADYQGSSALQSYRVVEPAPQPDLNLGRPIVDGERVFVDAHRFWAATCSHRLANVWAQPYREIAGAFGMFTVARSEEELSDIEIQEKNIRLPWLAHIAHTAMAHVLIRTMVPEAAIRLSTRETTVIRWTAVGKTSAEISVIMGLSVRTVTFHIGNVVKKLNVSNKTAAAVRAAVLGLL